MHTFIKLLVASSTLALIMGCNSNQQKDHQPLIHKPIAEKVSIEQIWNDYKENFSAATSKWTQVNITLTGTIDRIETQPFKSEQTNITKNYYLVTIQDQVNTACTGIIRMDDSAHTNQQVQTLKVGDTVTIDTHLYQPERFITGDIPRCSYLFDSGIIK